MNNLDFPAFAGDTFLPNRRAEILPLHPKCLASSDGLAGFEQVFVPHGTCLLTQGAKADYAFYILNGWVLEEELTVDGNVAWADIYVRGEVAGLNCVMFDESRDGRHVVSTASIQALTDVFAVRMPRAKMATSMDCDRNLAKTVFDTLRRQSDHLHAHIVALSARSAQDRVIMLLRALYLRALKSGALDCAGRLPISQVILARVANISVVHMNRIAQKLRQDGIVEWTPEGVNLIHN